MLLDTWLVFVRAMRQLLRNPFWMVFGLTQPILYLALFGPLLIRVVDSTPGFPAGDAWQIFVPALLVQMGMFGGLFVGFGIIAEYRAGVIERMRVTPASRTALLLGRVLRDGFVTAVQATLMVLIALLFGLRVPWQGAVLGLVLMVVLGMALAAASYGIALRLKSEDAFAPLLNAIVLPVVLLSGILLPMQLAPQWLYNLSRVNPFSHIVDAERAAFLGDFLSRPAAVGTAVTLVLALVMVAFGTRVFQRENA
ncbi:MAG TPA: ABC transporter permease [Pseudonocardiaceae bacterium]